MPSTSKKQHNFMEAVAHSPKFAAKAGVPTKVGKDFAAADKKQLKFAKGGSMKSAKPRMAKIKEMKSILSAVTHGGKDKIDPLAASAAPPVAMKKGGRACCGTGAMKKGGTVKKAFGGGIGKMASSGQGSMFGRPTGIVKRATGGVIGKLTGAMNHGGAVKKARGGGIEKQGKTKGKIFKRGGHVKSYT